MVTPSIPLDPYARKSGTEPPIWPDARITELDSLLQDAAIGAALEELTELTLAGEWRLSCAPAAPDLLIELDDAGLRQWARYALTALGRGLAVQQARWAPTRRGLRPTAYEAIDPDRIRLHIDAYGSLVGASVDDRPALAAPALLIHRHQPDALHPAGRTRISRAYRAYLARTDLITTWGTLIARNGGPAMLLRYPAATPGATLAAYRAELEAATVTGGVMLPDTVEATPVAPSYATTLSVGEALAYMDAQIRHAITLRWSRGTLLGRDTAYNSEAEARAEPHRALIDALRRELADTITRDLLMPLHRANHGPDATARLDLAPAPDVVTQPARTPTSEAER